MKTKAKPYHSWENTPEIKTQEENSKMTEEKTKGEIVKKFRASPVSATIWKNKGEKGEYNTLSLQRSFKVGEEWKNTTSLRATDIPKALLVLAKAYEYLALAEQE